MDAVKQAAKVAVAGAAVGAAAAAARALSHHGDGDDQPAQAEDEETPRDESAPAETEEPEQEEQPEPRQQEPEAEAEQAPEHEQEPEHEREPESEPVEGAAPSDAKATIDRAREQLEELLGRPVEAVSSFERTHDGWVVSLEVVEVSRIPETMDILGSYEMELDDSRNLRRYQQVRRYHRAQAERDHGS
jgi:cobalamin biosynthesis protein CobT